MKKYTFLRFIVFIRAILLLFNLFFAFALLLSYYATTISPESFWPLSFFGLAYPFLLLVNLMFVAMWAVQRHWLMLLSLIVILAGWKHLNNFISLNIFQSNESAEGLKVMSYNVQNFDLYNWSGNQKSRDSILSIIKSADPDVVCFQEFFTSDVGTKYNISLLKGYLGTPYHYFKNTFTVKGVNHWGIAIFSKYPIVEKGALDFGNSISNSCIYIDIEYEGEMVRIFNSHLQSIHLGTQDYAYIDKLVDEQETSMEQSRMVLSKLKRAFIKRASQADKLAAAIKNSPHPVVVCGDFNDTPVSYTYAAISEGLNDAFLLKGRGIGNSYAGKIPGLRIDFILTSPEFEILNFTRNKYKITDHFPVNAVIKWKE